MYYVWDACLPGESGRSNGHPNATPLEIDEYGETIDQALGIILAIGNILFPEKSRRLGKAVITNCDNDLALQIDGSVKAS